MQQAGGKNRKEFVFLETKNRKTEVAHAQSISRAMQLHAFNHQIRNNDTGSPADGAWATGGKGGVVCGLPQRQFKCSQFTVRHAES